MSEKEKENLQEKEKSKERDNSLNKNDINNNINSINNSDKLNNNINITSSQNNNNEVNPNLSSNNSPKSSYGGTYPSPFSSKSKSNYSNSKNSYHRSHSRSRSHSQSDSKSPISHSKSNNNSSHSNRSYHHKHKSIPQVFITKLNYFVTKRDLEKEFGKFGEIRNLTLKKGFGFVEYYDKKDAKYAIRELNGRRLFGQSNRIVVEEAKVSRQLREKERRRRRSKSRDKEKEKEKERDKDRNKEDKKEENYYFKRKTGPKKTDICFSCGKEGHWANECQENRRDR